jgi:NADH-quinone oxidoreductase subunit L
VQASLLHLTLITLFSPFLGCLIAGMGNERVGRRGAQWVTITLMALSFLCSLILFKLVALNGFTLNAVLYTWGVSGHFNFNVGFLIDSLSAIMMLIVTFVSLLVHIYSIGYMQSDASNPRFFSYVSLFTFAMLLLLTANNFFQLFVGWEGVGLVSYLLIGFYFTKPSAVEASLKAFIVNRVGDFGFILGIAAILDYFGSVDFSTVFAGAATVATQTISLFPGTHWSVLTVACILLLIGAMGKSSQVPLHVWLPGSMEGPTPISALIHAATMVTAGVYLVARMSPLFEFSAVALNLVLVIGATGALFLGLLAFVEYDIKRVIAFSTMSQLGYMMAADGASAFSAGIFHLLTHACFKALLFLSAGSIIIAMHHEQDLRKMGNLKKYLPWTCASFLIGACALTALPPFSGFYSKDSVIEAVHHSTLPGATYAYYCLLIGAFVTGFYIFRAYFMAFHTQERMDDHVRATLKEPHWSMRFAQCALAIPSIFLGMILINPMLYKVPSLLQSSVSVFPKYNVLAAMRVDYLGLWHMTAHAVLTGPFWCAISGVIVAWLTVMVVPNVSVFLQKKLPALHRLLVEQYYFDRFNDRFFVRGTRVLSDFFFRKADMRLIDHYMVDGTGRTVTRMAKVFQKLQTGYLYHYVLVMIIGVLAFLIWLLWG